MIKISLVGYTNTGKSSLFNRLTKAKAFSADKLFATLDTTTRKLAYVNQTEFVLSDTVGFVRDLPHSLVEAFKATLEETADSDFLFHVVDASSHSREFEMEQVQAVLKEIGADNVPQITIFNKIDLTDLMPGIDRSPCGKINKVRLSAITGEGIVSLRDIFPELLLCLEPNNIVEKKIISGFTNNSTTENVDFLIQDYNGKDAVKDLKLQKTFRTSNMHLFHPTKGIHKYETPEEILMDFITLRRDYYDKRKEYLWS